jgi:hypothetical protein
MDPDRRKKLEANPDKKQVACQLLDELITHFLESISRRMDDVHSCGEGMLPADLKQAMIKLEVDIKQIEKRIAEYLPKEPVVVKLKVKTWRD